MIITYVLVCMLAVILSQTPPAASKVNPRWMLARPVPEKCAQRPKQFYFRGHHYFYSGHHPEYKNSKLNWLFARNACRQYCMDLVSIETMEENDLIVKKIQQNNIISIWTSGRLCDFKGCENRPDLEPKKLNGWFWSATLSKMTPTNQIPQGWSYRPWSTHQPDNYIADGVPESCMSFQNNWSNDGIVWHDFACNIGKPFLCEDNDEFLNEVAANNPGIKL